jgi:hypothetical protein
MKYIAFDIFLPSKEMKNIEIYDSNTKIMRSVSDRKAPPMELDFSVFNYDFSYIMIITDELYNNFKQFKIINTFDYEMFFHHYNLYEQLI